MNHLNNLLLEGIATEPKIIAVANENQNWGKLVGFRLASHRYHMKDGKTVDDTLWMSVKCWGDLAESCLKFVEKGMTVRVNGRLSERRWAAKDGTERKDYELVAQHLEFRFRSREKDDRGEVIVLNESERDAERVEEPEFVYTFV